MYSAAQREPDRRERAELAKHAAASEKAPRLEAIVYLARSQPGIAARVEEFDADPFLLNCANGTLDLRSGELRRHDPGDLITKIARVHFDATADGTRWLSFLRRIFDGDEVIISYVQRALGYALTGDVGEQVLFSLFDRGANGKTTLLTTVGASLGDYARQAEPDLLLARRGERHPTSLADLAGARFVSSVEIEPDRGLAEAFVTYLTGGDQQKAHHMREDFFEFEPAYKLFLAVNHKPQVRSMAIATWRRFKLIPFLFTIEEGERDKRLGSKLQGELPGILNWVLQGCQDWQRTGLGEPKEVQEAGADYRQEMDLLADFLGQRCTVHPNTVVTDSELYTQYVGWCKRSAEIAMSQWQFNASISERGFTKHRSASSGANRWHGIGLRDLTERH
jgi:putative DNA primase/helicase